MSVMNKFIKRGNTNKFKKKKKTNPPAWIPQVSSQVFEFY